MFTQFELDFASTLASALDEPEQADVLQLWDGMLPELQTLSQHERLQIASMIVLIVGYGVHTSLN